MDNNFLIIGNDEKMRSCKKRLNELNIEADCLDAEISESLIGRYGNIILPLPTIANGCISGTGISVSSFNSILDGRQTIFCGNIKPDIFSCRAFSYYEDEGFLIKNSRLTAQGTLRIILDNISEDLHSLSAAVIGYGRCGKEICKILKNAGLRVTSFSRRRETITLAENDGVCAEHCRNINSKAGSFDITVNTVPFNLIDSSGLEKLTNDNIYIEIASKPYGFNIAGADKFNFRYVLAESLPGKYTPVSAGRNIADTVAGMIKEE